MALRNPGAEALANAGFQGNPETVDVTEEISEVEIITLTVDEMNKVFEDNLDALRNMPTLQKGDIVTLNALAHNLTNEYAMKKDQKALVLLSGQEAVKISGNVFSNVIVQIITDTGYLDSIAMSARFLKKVGVALTEKQKNNK